MHIGINGYFLGHEGTGSGQYLVHLLEGLLAMTGEHAYTLFIPASLRVASAWSSWLLEWAGESERFHDGRLRVVRLSAGVRQEHLSKLAFEQIAFPRACKDMTVMHVPYFASPLFPTRPTVVTIHDLIPLLLPLYRGDMRVRLYTQLVSAAARRAAAVLTDSAASAREIVRLLRIPAERVHVVYLAAEERYRPAHDLDAIASLRQRFRLPERYILYLGGYDQRRNIPTLLRAFAAAVQSLSRLGSQTLPRLVLAGGLPAADTAFTPDPRRIIRELGLEEFVQCLGHVAEADKPPLYAGAELFVFPSRYEGFGLPPLEAMACGVPVIAADAASLPEIVGDGGLLVGPDDVEGWAAAIAALWTQPERRRELGAKGLAQAACFSWRKTAEETLRVYEGVSQGHS